MVDLSSPFIGRLSRNSNTSESNHVKPDNDNTTTIIIFTVLAVALIAIILVSYCIWYKFCMTAQQKHRQRLLYSRPVPSLYASHTHSRSNTVSDSRPVSAIYIVPVRSDTILDVVEELPPSYYSFAPLQERLSELQERPSQLQARPSQLQARPSEPITRL
jgi:hypothetical protein